MRRNYLVPLMVGLFVLASCGKPAAEAPTPPPSPPIVREEIKRTVTIEAQGAVLRYNRESFWSEEKFSEILESKDKFGSEEINSFTKSLERYNKHAVNPKIEFDEVDKSTTLICDIEGAMYSTDSYDFHWLLGDLPFDLYAFKQSKKELNWEGEIDGVPTAIRLVFPYALDHCREHVWPAR